MATTNRMPVSPEIWEELSNLKKPGQTFDKLPEEMVEREKDQTSQRYEKDRRNGTIRGNLGCADFL